METRGLTAAHDAGTGVLTLWGVAKVPHFNRRVLGRPARPSGASHHFIELEVGGGFGVRGEFYPEDFLVPWAAMRLGRPVQWIEDRREHLMAANHSRQQYHDVEIGVRPRRPDRGAARSVHRRLARTSARTASSSPS
jgi:CO/xanthine dehydrogenase Mo-binding subunit